MPQYVIVLALQFACICGSTGECAAGSADVPPNPQREVVLATLRQLELGSGEASSLIDFLVLQPTTDSTAAESRPVQATWRFSVQGCRTGMNVCAKKPNSEGLPSSWEQIAEWDGERWREWMPAQSLLTISKQPSDGTDMDCLSMFAGTQGPSLVGGRSLLATIESGEVARVSDSADALICDYWEDPKTRTVAVHLVIRKGTVPAVAECVVSVGDSGRDFDAEPKMRIRYWVSEWDRQGDVVKPKLAYRDAYMHHAAAATSYARCVLRRCDEAESPPSIPDPLPPETTVLDNRLQLRFQAGNQRTAVLDGTSVMSLDSQLGLSGIRHLATVQCSELAGWSWYRQAFMQVSGAGLAGAGLLLLVRRASLRRDSLLQRFSPLATTGFGALGGIVAFGIVISATATEAPAANKSRGEQGPFRGDMAADLGIVRFLPGSPLEARFELALTNATDQPVEISKVVTTCGCTKARASPDRVGPHENFVVTGSLRFSGSERRSEGVSLVVVGQPPVNLRISGLAMLAETMWSLQDSVDLDGRGGADVDLIAVCDKDGTAPPDFQIQAPPGVVAIRGGWERIRCRDPERGKPELWRSQITLSASAGTLCPGCVLVLTDRALPVACVELTGRPWRRPLDKLPGISNAR